MKVDVAVTVKWDAAQFAVIAEYLSGSDRAKMLEVTQKLHASEAQLENAISSIKT
jgi:hypothetical protein